ncbi:MAG: YigZ family protein, partial [Flavobacteriaceae bacterium]|nr:YigZ family protein [Flavobacteriaceae bacterium]
DDGEPNNSAGQPIYGQIQAYDLTNVGIFVVRIFGGTKLGVGGLITAYKTAAQLALEEAKIIQKELVKTIELQFDYKFLSFVMSAIKKFNINILSQESNLNCTYIIEVPLKDVELFITQLEQQHQITINEVNKERLR